jgi:MYXO-CTERM domain-containing protein
VEAVANDVGYGVDTVRLMINGMDVPGGELTAPPYVWNGSYPPGQYTFQVFALDVAGNMAESEMVFVGVDMEPPTPEPPDDTGGSGTDEGSGGGSGDEAETDEAGGTGDEAGSLTGVPTTFGQEDPMVEGCGCRSRSSTPAAWMLALLGLLGLRRRK